MCVTCSYMYHVLMCRLTRLIEPTVEVVMATEVWRENACLN